MKKLLLLPILIFFLACNQNTNKDKNEDHKGENTENQSDSKSEDKKELAEVSVKDQKTFGEDFTVKNEMNAESMMEKFNDLKVGDTIQVQFKSEVKEVCAKKGCWMKMELPEDLQAMVRFKDYGFFMPKDIPGNEVVLNGKAFKEEMSVEDQKHYAEDSGESEEKIAAITEPKVTYSFLADGVKVVEE
ncbi:MAG: DUF4920 domain-containing protein [Psychroflexus sp.]